MIFQISFLLSFYPFLSFFITNVSERERHKTQAYELNLHLWLHHTESTWLTSMNGFLTFTFVIIIFALDRGRNMRA